MTPSSWSQTKASVTAVDSWGSNGETGSIPVPGGAELPQLMVNLVPFLLLPLPDLAERSHSTAGGGRLQLAPELLLPEHLDGNAHVVTARVTQVVSPCMGFPESGSPGWCW